MSWGGPAGPDPELLHGGAERGEFPYLAGRLPTGAEGAPGPALLSGKAPAPGDVLLEVNGTPVSGLTHRDTLAVIRHFREPVRLKTVRPGEPAGRARPLQAPRRGLRAAGPGARPKLARAARGAGGAAVRAGEAPALGPAGGPRGRAGQCGAGQTAGAPCALRGVPAAQSGVPQRRLRECGPFSASPRRFG